MKVWSLADVRGGSRFSRKEATHAGRALVGVSLRVDACVSLRPVDVGSQVKQRKCSVRNHQIFTFVLQIDDTQSYLSVAAQQDADVWNNIY